MSKFVKVYDASVQEAALRLCKGSYQRNIVLGRESLSGSTLKGKAKNWSMKYAHSRNALLLRFKEAGLSVHEEQQDHGRRVLVFGEPGCTCDQLPEFDMDGSRFDGVCKWCEKQMQDAYGPNQEWPPGAPKYS